MEIIIFFSIIALIIGLAIYFIFKSGIMSDAMKLVEKGVDATKENVGGMNIKKKTDLFKQMVEEKYQKNIKKKTNSDALVSKESKRKTKDNDYTATGSTYHRFDESSKLFTKISPSELDYIWSSIISRRRVGCFNCKSTDMYQMGGSGHDDYMRLQCPSCGQKAKLKINSNSKAGIECINLGKV